MSWLDAAAQRFFTRRRPGRMLAAIASAPIPLVTPGWLAEAKPTRAYDGDGPSAMIDGAGEARVGAPGGVLAGEDVVIKDQIDVAGMKTGVGLPDGGEVATQDATVVARILAAGGRIPGKAKMTELGLDGTGALMPYPMPHNPRAPGYAPGGSSTGTAVAVASRLARYGVGGDGLGSIRLPSAFCGLVGLRPGRTTLPREGIASPVRSLDSIGPMCRTSADCARLWQVMAGEPIRELHAWTPISVGVPTFSEPLSVAPSVGLAFVRALQAIGVSWESVEIRGFDRVTFLGGMIGSFEVATGPYAGKADSPFGRTSFAMGKAFSTENAARLEKQRATLRDETDRALAKTPVLAMPTSAIPPPAIAGSIAAGNPSVFLLRSLGAFTPLANLCDLPAIAVPCGVDDRGRPLSIMFVTLRGGEWQLLQIAAAVEATGLFDAPLPP
ncbi:MAG TPA: amidase [Kofleriaceae bacterium]|nr:amidase [Kofleriaceae bacterium]